MGLPVHLALVPDGVNIDASDLTRVAGAIGKQVQVDFGPIWNIHATISPYARLEDVPLDSWPVIIKSQVEGAAGYHEDENGQPFALVEADADWSLTASHETLEMLADPFGRRLASGNLLDQAIKLGLKRGRVRYLVEVCDPSEAGRFSYQVGGVTVSDFYTPHFFEPVKVPGRNYSFTGAISSPRTILEGGYISWYEPVSKHWMQLRMFPDELSQAVPHVVDLNNETVFSKLRAAGHNLRSAIDRVTKPPKYQESFAGDKLTAANVNRDAAAEAQTARAALLRDTIKALGGEKVKSARSGKGRNR